MPPEEQNQPTQTYTQPSQVAPSNNSQSGQAPNFDFIKAQPDPVNPGNSKRKLIIIVGIILIIILVVLAVVTRVTSNNTSTTSSQAVTSDQLVATYFSRLGDGNIDGAFELMDQSNGMTLEYFKNTQVPLLNAAYEIKTCKIIDTIESDGVYQTRLNCKTPTQKGGYETVVLVESVSTDTGIKITKMTELGRVAQ